MYTHTSNVEYVSLVAQKSVQRSQTSRVLRVNMTKNFLEILPIELVFRILAPDVLLPHEQSGFACASHIALQVSNNALARLAPPTRNNTFMSITGEWTAEYRKPLSELREAVEGTSSILPCPKITQGTSPRKSEVYIQTWLACKWLRQGDIVEAEQCLEIATDAARDTGVLPPYTSAIIKDGWRSRMYASLARRDSALRMGLVEMSQRFQEDVVQAAYHAEIPIPSFEAKFDENASWAQAVDMVVRDVLLTPNRILQSLWRYSLLL
jgi:hypothetical protein